MVPGENALKPPLHILLITHYFRRGYPYDAIAIGLLQKREGLQICVQTLKRRLKSLGQG